MPPTRPIVSMVRGFQSARKALEIGVTTVRDCGGRGAITISFIAASSLYAQQQCAGSEAPSVGAIILLTVAGLWVYRSSSSPLRWIVFAIALFAAFGTRHINYLFVLWLPLVIAGHLIWSLRQRQRR